jgi:hypothetical protein
MRMSRPRGATSTRWVTSGAENERAPGRRTEGLTRSKDEAGVRQTAPVNIARGAPGRYPTSMVTSLR